MEENITPRTHFDISHEKAAPTKNIAPRVPPSSKFFPHKYVTLVKTITNAETTWPSASKREQQRPVTRSTRMSDTIRALSAVGHYFLFPLSPSSFLTLPFRVTLSWDGRGIEPRSKKELLKQGRKKRERQKMTTESVLLFTTLPRAAENDQQTTVG